MPTNVSLRDEPSFTFSEEQIRMALEANGYSTQWNEDNWVKDVWRKDPSVNIDWAGMTTIEAFKSLLRGKNLL
jgi:hypothetical protein